MALDATDTWVVAANLLVLALALVLATLSYRSYRVSGNDRLLFIVAAFLVFVMKAAVIAYNDSFGAHFLTHHTALFVGGLFDVIIVVLVFIPFVAPRGR